MKKILILPTLAFFINSMAWGQGTSSPFQISVESQKSQTGSLVLHLLIKDAKPKSGVCPYYVKSLQFLEGINVLNVEVFQDVCLNEAYGVSQGESFWGVPRSRQTKGIQLTVLINGTPAGDLIFDEAAQSFTSKGM